MKRKRSTPVLYGNKDAYPQACRTNSDQQSAPPVTEIRLKSHPHVTFSFPHIRNLVPMRGAFVVRLSRETNPSKGHFEGSVEEVDSGKELKFRSSAELVSFLGACFQAAIGDTPKDDPFLASEMKPEADAQSNTLRSSNAISRRRRP